MNNLNYDLIKLQLYQLENDFNAKIDKLKKGMSIEEEKKIPEKMKEIENDDFLEIPSNHDIMNKINEVIDYLVYLKSKGE